MSSRQVHVSGAQFSRWWTNNFIFLEVCSKDFFFWGDENVNSRCYCRCVLSNMPQQKKYLTFNQQNNQFLWLQRVQNLPKIPFTEQKPSKTFFWWRSYTNIWKKTSRDCEKVKPSPYLRNLLANHNQAQPNLWQRRPKAFHLRHKRADSIMVCTFNQKVPSSFFHKISVYIKATCFSQPPTMILKGLLTSDQIQLLGL